MYVISTLRFLRHIGRVECVTCQVPWRKERGGAVKVWGVGWVEVEGGERVGGVRMVRGWGWGVVIVCRRGEEGEGGGRGRGGVKEGWCGGRREDRRVALVED